MFQDLCFLTKQTCSQIHLSYDKKIQPIIFTDYLGISSSYLITNSVIYCLADSLVFHGNKNNHRFPPEAAANCKHKLQDVIKSKFTCPEGIYINLHQSTNKNLNLSS